MSATAWILALAGLLVLTPGQSLAQIAPERAGSVSTAQRGDVYRGPATTFLPDSGAQQSGSGNETRQNIASGPSQDNASDVAQPRLPISAGHTSAQAGLSWRYRFHNNQWWYWVPEGRWVHWCNGRWNDYVPHTSAGAAPETYRSYRVDYSAAEPVAGYGNYSGYYGSGQSYGTYSASRPYYDNDHDDAFRGGESFGGFSRGGSSWR